MADSAFRHGEPLMIDYTPGSAVAAGAVIVLGSLTAVAHKDIPANTLGSLAIHGGVYDMTGSGSINPGLKVYWDNTNKNFTTTSAGNTVFGYTVEAAALNAISKVFHNPTL